MINTYPKKLLKINLVMLGYQKKHMVMYDENDDGFITIKDIKNANFIDITLKYEQIIITIH